MECLSVNFVLGSILMSFIEKEEKTYVLSKVQIIQHISSFVGGMHDWVPREKTEAGKWFNSVYIQGICNVILEIEFQEAVT